MNPLHINLSTGTGNIQNAIIEEGYPIIEDVELKKIISHRVIDRALIKFGDLQKMQKAILGRELQIRLGSHVIQVKVTGFMDSIDDHNNYGNLSFIKAAKAPDYESNGGYRWWTWKPDLHYLGIFNSLVFFIATILFFIPACAWLPMDVNGASLSETIFWVYVLQIIPSVGFVYVGHAAMAEAAGSWIKPKLNDIGWWVSFFNTIGGYGFLLCAILAIPCVEGDPGCSDNLNKWGSALSTFWGSCAFWVAGVLECMEFGSEHPITFSSKKKSN